MGVIEHAEDAAGFAAIADLIERAESICVCAHTNPDGDALGSVLALAAIIELHWAGKQLALLNADDEPIPRIYRFLPGSERMISACDYVDAPDLFISVDLSTPSRLGNGEAVLARARTTAIIDHHPCDNPCADAYVVRTSAAAAGVLVGEFACFLGVEITPDIAQNLFCALVTDTGRFQYQNSDAEAFAIASLLVDCGASPAQVSLNVYQSFRLSYLHLQSAVMGRIVSFEKGRIAYSYATTADLERTGASLDECDGLIDVVRCVEGSEVALFLKEVPGGLVRGNLRSKTGIDVSGVAQELGGGGHRASAGFTSQGSVDEVLAKALPKLQALLAAYDKEVAERA